MRTALASSAKAAGLRASTRRRYLASASEQEAIRGIFEAEGARDHVHCFFRTIVGAPQAEVVPAFRDDGESQELVHLKGHLRAFLGKGGVHEYKTGWENG